MPDIADDRAAYLEAMRRAEEASGISRDTEGNEVYTEGEPPVATPELEGAVPVQASDQPLTPEPAVEADTSGQEQPAEPAAEPTAEELKAELAAAQARIEEQKTMIGRQSAEVGTTREEIAALKARIDAMTSTPVTPTAPAIAITQELIDSNPAAAVQTAFAQRDEHALQIAFEAWKDPLNPNGDPFAAATWLNDRKLEQQQAAFEAKIAEQEKRLETVTAPLAESNEQREWGLAFDEVKATRPDFLENAERLLTEVAPQYPAIADQLSVGDHKVKAQALEALYALDKMGNPQAVQAQLEEAAQEAAAEAAAARAAAGVTTQSTAGQPAELKTQEELEQESYISRQRSKPSLSKGWTGRS